VTEFELDGLVGDRSGNGLPALLLHGGPGLSDYMGPLADELDGVFETFRYTQRGTPPSTSGPPYTVEAHVEDAVAVLDRFGVERAWAIGHSWGGHLALHLAVAQPDRLRGVICINALGASSDGLEEFGENLRRPLAPEEAERVESLEPRERLRLLWPGYFADQGAVPEMPDLQSSAECNTQTFASVNEHFEAGTLVDRLPSLQLQAVFVHGDADPFPSRVSAGTARLIPGAVHEDIPDCGHFPWLEKPGETRRIVERFLG
jgi:pimeloyl-ACP methyl ester carboxylesterase